MNDRKLVLDLNKIWDRVNHSLKIDAKTEEQIKEAIFDLGSEQTIKDLENMYVAQFIQMFVEKFPDEVKYR